MEMEVDFDEILRQSRQELVSTDAPVEVVPAVPPVREATWDAVVEGLRRGLTLPRACALVGADIQAIKRLAKADPRRQRELAGAKAGLIKDLTDVVVHAATEDGEWRAAAWLLPKLDPTLQERKKPTVQITKNVLNVGEVRELEQASDEDLRKLLGMPNA